jgi:hypothetical protein
LFVFVRVFEKLLSPSPFHPAMLSSSKILIQGDVNGHWLGYKYEVVYSDAPHSILSLKSFYLSKYLL